MKGRIGSADFCIGPDKGLSCFSSTLQPFMFSLSSFGSSSSPSSSSPFQQNSLWSNRLANISFVESVFQICEVHKKKLVLLKAKQNTKKKFDFTSLNRLQRHCFHHHQTKALSLQRAPIQKGLSTAACSSRSLLR